MCAKDTWKKPWDICLQVYYVNEGMEYLQDSIVMEIEFVPSKSKGKSELPQFLRVRQRFLLQISIRPINDKPRIDVHDRLVRVASGTRKHLSPEMFQVMCTCQVMLITQAFP